MEIVKLKNGMEIPAIIFGPDELGYKPRKKKSKFRVVRLINKIKLKTFDSWKYVSDISNAIKVGFHSIDFSAAYGDGRLISKAIKKSGIERNEMFLITRVSNKAQFLGRGVVEAELNNQLKGFETDYVDMLMLHWPVTDHYEETWKEMIRLRDKGLCKYLGVSNCHEHHLKKIYDCSGEYPLINQVEIHPLFSQLQLRNFCKECGIQVMAYSPTARQDDRLFNPLLLKNIANKYKKSPTQIILRWHIQNGIIPVIRTLNYSHQKDDIDIFDFCISNDDMKMIDNLNINARIRYDPDNCDFNCL